MNTAFVGRTRKPNYYIQKKTSYHNLKKTYYDTPMWNDIILSCIASGGHPHIIRKYLNDDPIMSHEQMAYIAIAGNNHFAISLLSKHIPENIILDKHIIHTLSRGNMSKNLKTIKYYYQLYPHRNMVDDIDFYSVYRKSYMPLFIYYSTYINATNVKKIMDLHIACINQPFVNQFSRIMKNELHIQIIVKLHLNKYYIDNIKRRDINNVIHFLHYELKYDRVSDHTQFMIIRMIIKYCQKFNIKRMQYFNTCDNKSERDLHNIGYYTNNISCYYLDNVKYHKLLNNIKKFIL